MVHSTLGDGRCMFRAVALVTHELTPLDDTQEEVETDRLRTIAMTAMRTNTGSLVEDTYNWNVTEDFDRSIKHMDKTTEYAESAEVIALTVDLNRTITVVAHIDAFHVVDYRHVYAPHELQEHLNFDPAIPDGDRIVIFLDVLLTDPLNRM